MSVEGNYSILNLQILKYEIHGWACDHQKINLEGYSSSATTKVGNAED